MSAERKLIFHPNGSTSNECIAGLINLYKNFSCLWDVTSEDYLDEAITEVAYKKLVQYMKNYDQSATVNSVKRHIMALENTFLEELRLVESSVASGGKNVYVPRLWYYDLFLFLRDTHIERNDSSSETEIDNENVASNFADEKSDIIEEFVVEGNESKKDLLSENENSLLEEIPSESKESNPGPSYSDEFLKMCSKSLKKICNRNEPKRAARNLDEYDGLSINWASKLRKLNEHQKMLTEDLIHDVLKKAYYKKLTEATQIYDE